MIIDLIIILALAKCTVMLFEDAAYAVRGKRSPRLEQRAGQAHVGGMRRSADAAGGYFAGLVEDGVAAARSSRRRRQARKRGKKAVDGVFVDLADDDHWYADCDVCGWSSRPFRIEENAKAAGAEHTRIAHPDTDIDKEDTPQEPPAEPATGEVEAAGRQRFKLIPGGAGNAEPAPAPVKQALRPTESVVHNDCTYCLGCPKCAPRTWAWRCDCDARGGDYPTEQEAKAAAAAHKCQLPKASTDRPDQEDTVQPHEPVSDGAAADAPTSVISDPAGGTDPPSANSKKEKLLNLEATGPDEIRAAFDAAHDTLTGYAEEMGAVVSALTEGADRYESLKMAGSTIAILRDVIDSLNSVESDLGEAAEQMTAAKADFDASDGQVADTVADTGGNVASEEILVG